MDDSTLSWTDSRRHIRNDALKGDCRMDMVHENAYAVFVRADRSQPWAPERAERRLASCATYEEARRVLQACRDSGHKECVIRYEGVAGGGD
jgi:hypothetical protein